MRTFAVVGRLLSITRAAEELNVTPSAVSYQIKMLQDFLGKRLFHRERNKLRLTPAGQQYLTRVCEALTLLSSATSSIRVERRDKPLRVGVPPSLGTRWLVPRLCGFTRECPEVALTVTASPEPLTLLKGEFDLVLWYGAAATADLRLTPLGPNHAFPICSPKLLAGQHALRSPADLTRCTLLDSSDESYYLYPEPRQPDWFGWLQSAGLNDVCGRRYMNFTPRVLMHEAVAAGLGVGLSRSLLAIDALAAHQIAVPFGPAVSLTATYNLVEATQRDGKRDVERFRDWLVAEAEASTKELARLLDRIEVI